MNKTTDRNIDARLLKIIEVGDTKASLRAYDILKRRDARKQKRTQAG